MQLISRLWTLPLVFLFLFATATSALANGGTSDVVVQTQQTSGPRKLKFEGLGDSSKTSGNLFLYNTTEERWDQIGHRSRPAGQQDVTEQDLAGTPQVKYVELGNANNTDGAITDLDPVHGPSGGGWQRSS